MNAALVDQIADAVLYEGYLLYPYRPSVKNRQRWTFGGLYPRPYSEARNGTDPWMSQTECLIESEEGAEPERPDSVPAPPGPPGRASRAYARRWDRRPSGKRPSSARSIPASMTWPRSSNGRAPTPSLFPRGTMRNSRTDLHEDRAETVVREQASIAGSVELSAHESRRACSR